ncbi:SMODS domain-containing nucleotidyltransferase [Winogradskya humida]|nr:hypothetical protein [Actinoplanes humidus]
MRLHDYFAGLLRNVVNINPHRLDRLEKHVAALSGYLGEDSELSSIVKGFVRQGSWAHRTIIKPLPDREFDADLLVRMKRQPSWSADPRQYLLSMYETLAESGRYRSRITLKTRCVRVSYAGDCHVDLVPYVHEYGWFDRDLIVDRKKNQFEEINPKGFSEWMLGRDRVAGGNLRTTVRLLKYMRDYKGTFDAPSVILTVVVGGQVNRLDAFFDRYCDLPTAFTSLVKATDSWLQKYPDLPHLPDPSCPGVSFEHRLSQPTYAKFRTRFHGYAGKISEAYEATRRAGSIELWQEIFGEGFAPPT